MKYKNRRHLKKQKSQSKLMDRFFIQFTACSIIMLGMLIMILLSPASYMIRVALSDVLSEGEFFGPSITSIMNNISAEGTVEETTQPSELQNDEDVQDNSVPEDFRIDEQILEEMEWRNINNGNIDTN